MPVLRKIVHIQDTVQTGGEATSYRSCVGGSAEGEKEAPHLATHLRCYVTLQVFLFLFIWPSWLGLKNKSPATRIVTSSTGIVIRCVQALHDSSHLADPIIKSVCRNYPLLKMKKLRPGRCHVPSKVYLIHGRVRLTFGDSWLHLGTRGSLEWTKIKRRVHFCLWNFRKIQCWQAKLGFTFLFPLDAWYVVGTVTPPYSYLNFKTSHILCIPGMLHKYLMGCLPPLMHF